MKQSIVLAALLALSPFAQAIDCQRAAALDERRICATPSLLALDRELASAYGGAQQGSDLELLRADQQRWLRETRKPCGGNEACLDQVYRQRLTLLKAWNDVLPLPAVLQGNYPMKRSVPLYDPGSQRWQTEQLQDCLRIDAPLSSGELPLRIYTVQTNGHRCEIEAWASRDGDSLLAEQEGSDGQPCRVRLQFLAQRVRVLAESPACQHFCGARASLHQVEYLLAPGDTSTSSCNSR